MADVQQKKWAVGDWAFWMFNGSSTVERVKVIEVGIVSFMSKLEMIRLLLPSGSDIQVRDAADALHRTESAAWKAYQALEDSAWQDKLRHHQERNAVIAENLKRALSEEADR